jgi:hypothetical protein
MRLQHALFLTALCLMPAQISAQDLLPREILDKIIPQLSPLLESVKVSSAPGLSGPVTATPIN